MLSRLSNTIFRSGHTKQLSTNIRQFSSNTQNEKTEFTYKDFYALWILIGGISGSGVSAGNKISDIKDEPNTDYDIPEIEKPFEMVYHTGRVLGYGALGFAVGGLGAATAPVSIPAYFYWKTYTKE